MVPGKSWGSLKGPVRVAWAQRGCDTVLVTDKSFACGDVWGEAYLKEWRGSEKQVCAGRAMTTCLGRN